MTQILIIDIAGFKSALTSALAGADAPNASTVPILSGIHLQVRGQHLTIRATDRYSMVRTTLDLGMPYPDLDMVVRAEDVKTALKSMTLTAMKNALAVGLDVHDDHLVFTMGDGDPITLFAHPEPLAAWPEESLSSLEEMLDMPAETGGPEAITCYPTMLARIAAAAPKERTVTIERVGERKVYRTWWEASYGVRTQMLFAFSAS